MHNLRVSRNKNGIDVDVYIMGTLVKTFDSGLENPVQDAIEFALKNGKRKDTLRIDKDLVGDTVSDIIAVKVTGN